MQVEQLVQLVESGNTRTVEDEWMSLLERADLTPQEVSAWIPVIEALTARDQFDLAESLAWATVETLIQRAPDKQTLPLAADFLLRLPRSEELREQVIDLYLREYADREGLDALLDASGLTSGRPPRGALRTLELCLAIQPGAYVVSRGDGRVARVTAIDPADWQITVDDGSETRTGDPRVLADDFERCPDDDFRVLLRFDRERLLQRLASEPDRVVAGILRSRGGTMTGDDLESLLSPRVIRAEEWPKWWTRARTAIKRAPNIMLEGRNPYVLTYVADAATYEEQIETRFASLTSAAEQSVAFEEYLRECKLYKDRPSRPLLARLRARVADRAARLEQRGATLAFPERLVEGQIGRALADESTDAAAVGLLARSEDPASLMRACASPGLWREACVALEKARPIDQVEVLATVLPHAPSAICGEIADRLAKADLPADGVAAIMQSILADPVECHQALCWLWDAAPAKPGWDGVPPLTLLTRMFWLLEQIRRGGGASAETAKSICGAVKSALSARRYERFVACLTSIEEGMASALVTRIRRLDGLGRNVREDLIRHIRDRFPGLTAKPETPDWARDDVLLATSAGIARMTEAINELVNVKMRENAKAIGAAAAKGDLSENSEYKFALEERDLLRARLRQMQEQMALVQVLESSAIPVDRVGAGSKVSLRHVETGAEFEMTFLGPFEADANRRIYNYKSPLGQEVMGRRVGDRVELPIAQPPGLYEISAVTPWDA